MEMNLKEDQIKNDIPTFEESKSKCRINMEKAKTKSEKQYWCGFIGGITFVINSLEKEVKE